MPVTPAEKLAALVGPRAGPVACAWLGLADATGAEIAGLAGFRLAVVDTEHGLAGPAALPDILRAFALHGGAAMVRLGSADEGAVKRALDAGAAGILFPQVETVEAARAVVAASLYPPAGRRGSAVSVVRAAGFGAQSDYQANWNTRCLTGVQIESRAGLSAAEGIAAVPGVDLLFFGPFDYASDAGLDPVADAAELAHVFDEIVAAARASEKIAGAFPWPGADPAALAAQGAAVIACGSDIRLLVDGFTAARAAFEDAVS
ncbi:MAG: aldolase/citrate lyase family protein [Pseudomonadota bacterium]